MHNSPLPHPLNLGAFAFREATDAGISRRRLRQPDVAHVHRGLYAPAGAVADLREDCINTLSLLGEDRCFSHLTAARLWGIPVPFAWAASEPLHVLAVRGAEPLRRPRIVGWESAAHPGEMSQGMIPLVSPAATWAQLSIPGATGTDLETGRKRALSLRWLVAAGDYVLTGPRVSGSRVPLCTRDELVEAVDARHGRRGARALAWALERVRTGPQSPRESLLRLALMDHGLPEPVIQPPVQTADGIRHSDLGYPEARLLIEYQGDHHRTDARQWREDLHRQQLFEDAGYRVIAVTIDAFNDDCAALAHRVRRALVGRFSTG